MLFFYTKLISTSFATKKIHLVFWHRQRRFLLVPNDYFCLNKTKSKQKISYMSLFFTTVSNAVGHFSFQCAGWCFHLITRAPFVMRIKLIEVQKPEHQWDETLVADLKGDFGEMYRIWPKRTRMKFTNNQKLSVSVEVWVIWKSEVRMEENRSVIPSGSLIMNSFPEGCRKEQEKLSQKKI